LVLSEDDLQSKESNEVSEEELKEIIAEEDHVFCGMRLSLRNILRTLEKNRK